MDTSPSSRRPLHRLTSTNRLVDYTSGGKNLEPVGAIITFITFPSPGVDSGDSGSYPRDAQKHYGQLRAVV